MICSHGFWVSKLDVCVLVMKLNNDATTNYCKDGLYSRQPVSSAVNIKPFFPLSLLDIAVSVDTYVKRNLLFLLC